MHGARRDRRRSRRQPVVALSAAAAAVVCAVLAAGCRPSTDDATPPPPPVTAVVPNAVVQRVVDGDTIVVRLGRTRETVRLIGIDTPETVDERKPVQCYGPEASARTKALLPAGTWVALERDTEARDRYGRLLAYVRRAADGLFVNLDLIQGGHAAPMRIEPNTTHAGEFAAAAAAARAAGAGLWGACGGPGVPLPSR